MFVLIICIQYMLTQKSNKIVLCYELCLHSSVKICPFIRNSCLFLFLVYVSFFSSYWFRIGTNIRRTSHRLQQLFDRRSIELRMKKSFETSFGTYLGMDARNASLMIGYFTILGSLTLICLEVTTVNFVRDDIFSPTIKEFDISKYYLSDFEKNMLNCNKVFLQKVISFIPYTLFTGVTLSQHSDWLLESEV